MRRKAYIFIVIAVSILLTGCGNGNSVPKLSFPPRLEAKLGAAELSADLSLENEKRVLVLITPENISGARFILNSEAVDMEIGKIKSSSRREELIENFLAAKVLRVIGDVTKCDLSFVSENENKLLLEAGELRIVCDKSGVVSYLRRDSDGLEICFGS